MHWRCRHPCQGWWLDAVASGQLCGVGTVAAVAVVAAAVAAADAATNAAETVEAVGSASLPSLSPLKRNLQVACNQKTVSFRLLTLLH